MIQRCSLIDQIIATTPRFSHFKAEGCWLNRVYLHLYECIAEIKISW